MLSLAFLRTVLSALSLFFAHFLGRALGAVTRGRQPQRALYGWILRYVLTIGAICYRGVDRLAILTIVADLVVFALGLWDSRRPKRDEDLTRTMFPDQQ